MIHPKKIEVFVDQLEDEICKRTDINNFEEFMVSLTKELVSRYLITSDLSINGINDYIKVIDKVDLPDNFSNN